MKIFIILVNYNSFDHTLEGLESIYANEKKIAFEIIVVDNASKEFPTAKLKKQFPNIQIIQSKENLGFAGGNNLAIRSALEQEADFILLINNDTTVSENFLSRLLETASKHPEAGIIAPLITYYSTPEKIWFGGAIYNDYIGFVKYQHLNKNKAVLPQEPFETSFITGCCMLIPRHTIKKVGLLHEPYFLYSEDLDYCYRVKKAGFKLLVDPQAEIQHKVSGSSSSETNKDDPHHFNEIKAYYCARNDFLFIKRNLKGIKKLTATGALFLIKHPYFISYLLRKKNFPSLKKYLKGIKDSMTFSI